ncbi:PHP domain-containing protein [Bacillaceae bacterium]
MFADLHTHTTASDGTRRPRENVRLAKAAGLRAVAITDHDTVGGIAEALAAGRETGIEVVPGIEISTLHEGQDVHVLGYYVDFRDERFLERLSELRGTRDLRNRMMVEKLRELGIEITLDEVYARRREERGNVGRPHIAEVLVEKGIVGSLEEAFDVYLGKGGKAYVTPPRIAPQEAIDLIRQAGGVPVLAHPGVYGDDGMVEKLIRYGLAGIEVFHPDHDEEDEARYRRMAERYGILLTAGSDFHGEREGKIFHAPVGTKKVPFETVARLKALAR